MKKIALFLSLSAAMAVAAAAETPAAAAGEIESHPRLTLQITTQPAAKLIFDWRFVFPFLRGDGPLTRGNNVSVAPGVELTPVSFAFTLNAAWTPIAFLEVVAGGRIGSGWTADILGGRVHGIGLNLPTEDGGWRHDGGTLDGAQWELRGGAALQASLSAFVPGKWGDVVARSFHGLRLEGYSRGAGGRPWFFENDDGQNRNGLAYVGNLFVGYQMPIPLSMVGLLAEANALFSGPRSPGRSRADFGDDAARWTFSALLNFSVTERFDVALISQFRARANFADGIGREWRDADHFTLREATGSRRLEFHRAIASLSYRF